ncbi:LacI family DNA-binding transcriptional regulator [Fibrella forsythiae]|uniref:LacI family DNA-binding transcriptional regulator n=1 Tax=Fibrella forsythiae TaxID=2817061 RepID=A0ABS3JN52_9BACT|nr:LacI family DNA-binding transcriptional regulator [Fibrella forsythiae]MBO0951442.1 LacI family DNA-binding transcriptional regulator [Fibrella forsythiae]
MKKLVTLKELSLELGVSVSTVSKALNNDPTIGHYTRERVEHLARARHYIPNQVARNFQRRRSLTIGLIVPNVLDQFFVQAINGVDEVATAKQYSVLVSQTLDVESRSNAILDLMRLDGVDGLIATITPNTTNLTPYRQLEAAGIPVVYIARSLNDPACAQVTLLNTDSARIATNFLLDRGHQQLAYINGPTNVNASQQRRTGFEQALQDRHRLADGTIYQPNSLTAADTDAIMAKAMARADYPTGILAFKTYMAIDAITYLKRTYPERLDQIEFVGFGNLPLLKHLSHKPAASIEENPGLMGQEAMRLLMQLISDKPAESTHIEVPGELVVH